MARYSARLLIILFIASLIFALGIKVNAKVMRGSGDDQSLFDAIDETIDNQNENIDDEVMQKGIATIDNTIGVLISVAVYLMFAVTGFTTACDLLYIGMPVVRPYLDGGTHGGTQMGVGNPHRAIALRAEQEGHFAYARTYHAVADRIDAKRNPIRDKEGKVANRSLISLELRKLIAEQRIASQNSNFSAVTGRNLVRENSVKQSFMLAKYIKVRAVNIVLMVVVLFMLVGCTCFTDLGLNIGALIYQGFVSILGG